MSAANGWRARIGVIYPASGLADMEYYRLCPPGVSVHVTRSSVPNAGGATLEDVTQLASEDSLGSLAADLATTRPSVVAWMCTSGSFSRGREWDAEMRSILSAKAGCPATTTSEAMVVALSAIGVKRVAVAAPYESEVVERLVAYLTEAGFDVVSSALLGLQHDLDITALSPNELTQLVRDADHSRAEAVFVSCTSIVLSPFTAALASDVGKPVFSANMATMWHAVRLAGVGGPLPAFGALGGMCLEVAGIRQVAESVSA
jgi:maleate isomerase